MTESEVPRILIATGKLCAGKTTLMSRLVLNHGFQVVSAITTREPRTSDFNGEYDYLSDSEFDALDTADMLWNRRHGSSARYTMLRSTVQTAISDTRHMYARPLSPHSAVEVAAEFNSAIKVLYLPSPETDELEKRLSQRGQNIGSFIARIENEQSWDVYALEQPTIHIAKGRTTSEIEDEALKLMATP